MDPNATVDHVLSVDGPPTCLAGRYELERWIGSGGSGQVWAARDLITGEQVAVKLIAALTVDEISRVRREVAALRRARLAGWTTGDSRALPGVVHLRDEGLQGGMYFVVTDVVLGDPFPGSIPRPTWAELGPVVVQLLRTLRRLHTSGIVHRDLKPGNVLVNRAGAAYVLDFGTATGPAVGGGERDARLTPRYAAPERLRGEPGDARTDLFAVGVMIAEALDEAPPDVVLDMMAPRPADRPRSVSEVLRALVGDGADPIAAMSIPEAPTAGSFEPLFAGPDAFLHLREDAAAALWLRTRGDADAARLELERWVDEGAADVVDGLVTVDRSILDRLTRPQSDDAPSPGEVDHLLERGEVARASALGQYGVQWARFMGDRAAETAFLLRIARCGVAGRTSYALEQALYEFGRASADDSELACAEALIRAELAVRAKEVDRAHGLLGLASAIADSALQTWWWQLRVRLAALVMNDACERALGDLRVWAAEVPARQQAYLYQLGVRHYAAGRYADAAEVHLRAASASVSPEQRVRSLLAAGVSLLELPDHVRLALIAHDVASLARGCRHPAWELRATWLGRSSAYRCGEAGAPRVDLVEAARRVGGEDAALLALNEAAVAWRSGDRVVAGTLAAEAEASARRRGRDGATALASALRIACVGPRDEVDVGEVVQQADRCAVPEIAVQAFGLLRRWSDRPEWGRAARSHLAACDPARGRMRLDVLSLSEAVIAPPRG